MPNETTHNAPLKVAAPYYGSLWHPVRGLSSLYLLLDVRPEDNTVTQVRVSVWNPAGGYGLGNWLKKMGATTLFCRGLENLQQSDLASAGIRVEPLGGRDTIEGIRNWLAEAGSSLSNPAGPRPSTGS